MVSSTLVKISAPVTRSCLIGMSIALAIDAGLTILAAYQYPYLIDHYADLYISSSRSITIAYTSIGLVASLAAISGAIASYKSNTNYVLIHACITGVFLPISILVYFTTISARYKPGDYEADYHHMIENYRIGDAQTDEHSNSETKLKLISLINLIDTLQTKFKCCGVESVSDWNISWKEFIAPSCCDEPHKNTNETWASLFKVPSNYEFKYCIQSEAYIMSCLTALKEDERSKYAWLSDLIVFMIVITLANTIVSLLLFGLTKTENMPNEINATELSIVGVSSKPRPSQPTITGIRPRKSVIQTLSPVREHSSISPAVRFKLSHSPRASISGPSKFSPAARRGSAFI